MWISNRWLPGVVAAALIALTIATRVPLLRQRQAIDDEVVYAVVAQSILDGGQPYVDAVERKPPLLFYVYAGVLKTFGRVNWQALHAVEIGWILVTMAGLYTIGRRLFDIQTGLAAAMLYSVFQAWGYWNNLAFNGEVLMNLPIVWAYAIALFAKRPHVGLKLACAGSLVSIGFLLKQPAAIAGLPLGAYLLLGHRGADPAGGFRRAAWFAVGISGTIAMTAVWLNANNLLQVAFYWTITDHDVPHIFWDKALDHTIAFIGLCFPIVAGSWASVRDTRLWKGKGAERITLVGLVVASALGAAESGRFYPHYYIALVPPLSLLTAPWLARMWNPARTPDRRWPARFAAVYLGATVAVFMAAHVCGLSRLPEQTEAGRFLLAHTSEDQRIFVWGQATRIYLDARRQPASRFIATFPLTGYIFGPRRPGPEGSGAGTRDRILPGSWRTLWHDFAAHPPAYVVDTEVGTDARYPVALFRGLDYVLATAYLPVARTAEGIIYERIRCCTLDEEWQDDEP